MDEQTTPETEVSQGITEDQAVNELLSRWGAQETAEPEAEAAESAEAVQEGEPGPAEEATAEESQEGAEQAEDDSGEIEVDVAGEKFSVPKAFQEIAVKMQAKAKEVEAGATRKFQEAADLRKAAESQIESAKQLQRIAHAQSDLLADHKMVSKRLQQLEQIDINQVDTDTLTRLNAEYNQLQAAARRIEAQYAQSVEEMQKSEAEQMKAKLELAEKSLATDIKGWGPEYGKKLADYAISRGAPPDVIAGITDAWMVKILDDAAYGHAMRTAKLTDKRAALPSKTLRPGAAGATKPAAQAKAEQAFSRLKKTGGVEDAAMALLTRSATRKR